MVFTVTVKNGNSTLRSGDKVQKGSTITVSVKRDKSLIFSSITINGQVASIANGKIPNGGKGDATATVSLTVNEDTQITITDIALSGLISN